MLQLQHAIASAVMDDSIVAAKARAFQRAMPLLPSDLPESTLLAHPNSPSRQWGPVFDTGPMDERWRRQPRLLGDAPRAGRR